MGGLHSGRTRKHPCIDDCIVVDLAQLKKEKMLAPGRYVMQFKHWTETDFIKKKEHTSCVAMIVTEKQIALGYEVGTTGQVYTHLHQIELTRTSCNYGGSRLWFLAPCCGARVRVLYLSRKGNDLERLTPQCRKCLDLHYASQMASYVERHKTYERHLLANYGYAWAQLRYDFQLKEHYLKVTPELLEMRLRHQLMWQMHILKRLMAFNRLMARDHSRALNSLKKEDDQREYTAWLLEEWGPDHTLEIIGKLSKLEVRAVAAQEVARWIAAREKSEAPPLDITWMISYKEQLEEDLAQLKKVA